MSAPDRAARERKQKIFVAVGGVVLLVLLVIQLPKLMGGSSSESAAPTATDTVVDSPVTDIAPSPVPVVLSDTDRPLAAAPGKLTSFTVFSRKDPFVQQVKTPSTTGKSGTGGKGENKNQSSTGTTSTGFAVGAAAASVTVISVNGVRQALVPGAAFPTANPVFVLVAEQPNAKTVTIGIAGGAYENGAKATKLKVGKALVLVNTTTGARYRLVLVAVGNGSAGGTSGDRSSKSAGATEPSPTP